MYVYMHACTCVCVYVQKHIHVHMCVCIYVYLCTYVCFIVVSITIIYGITIEIIKSKCVYTNMLDVCS